MLSLIKKDILVTLKSDKLLLLSYIATMYIFYTLFNPFAYCFASVFFSYLILSRSFYYDNENDSNRFIMSMPTSKEDIVYSKYILGFGLIILITMINNACIELMSGQFFRGTVLNDVLSSLTIYLILISIVLPTFFIFKNQNISKFIGIVVGTLLFLVSVFFIIASDMGPDTNDFIWTMKVMNIFTINFTFYNLSIISVIIYIFSMFLSLKIVNIKKGGKNCEKVC